LPQNLEKKIYGPVNPGDLLKWNFPLGPKESIKPETQLGKLEIYPKKRKFSNASKESFPFLKKPNGLLK